MTDNYIMFNKVYVARHTQTEFNRKRIIQGWKDSPLTKDGRRDAVEIASALITLKANIKNIISSPLGRAEEFSRILSLWFLDAPIKYDDRLKEQSFGVCDGMPYDEYHQLFKYRLNFRPDGGETLSEVFARSRDVLYEAISSSCGNEHNILIVTHYNVVALWFQYFLLGMGTGKLEIELDDEFVFGFDSQTSHPFMLIGNYRMLPDPK